MRRLISTMFIAVLLLSTPSCWDLLELNQISVVGIIGIDYDAQGDGFEDTVHVHHPKPSGGQEQGGGQATGMMVVTTRGQTIMDALRNLRSSAGYRLTFHHARLIIIGEDLARKGV